MKCKNVKPGIVIVAVLLLASVGGAGESGFTADVETGLVFSGYNDVRIPGDSGTLFSLSEELKTESSAFFRLRLGYTIGRRHSLLLLLAPLRLKGEGSVNRPVVFENEEFPADALLKSTYRFDSYRLSYRYGLRLGPEIEVGLGATAKIRDASISLESDGQSAEKKNTGLVPLASFRVRWRPLRRLSLLLDGDALAAPQGRAEDILLAAQYDPSQSVGLKFGYRILEGGADVDEVYNFTLIHYLVVGGMLYL
jgi:hypothetical protein